MDYEYFLKHCKLIAIGLSKQIELVKPNLKQQINFIERLERNEGATIFFIIENNKMRIYEGKRVINLPNFATRK